MTRFSNNFRRRAGTTLIEVLAGLLILGTSLVGLLAAKARHTRQWATAQRQLEAAAAAETLLTAWWQAQGEWPRNDSGNVPGHPGLTWRTGVVGNDAAGKLRMQVIRLEILASDGGNDRDAQSVLTGVELVLPEPKAAQDSPVSAAGETNR